MGHMNPETVDAPAHMAVLYARAVAGSVLPGPIWGGGDHIPDRCLMRESVRFTAEEVHAYREVCGGSGPDLPPAMLHLAGFPLAMQLMTARDFPMGALGMVHIANRIEVGADLPALAAYDITVHIDAPRAHRKGTEFDVLTTATLDGTQVWRESSTYLSRGRRLPGTKEAAPVQWPPVPDGAVLESLEVPADTGRRYASVSGDRNPIHLHPLAARAFGFPAAIAHGMWTLARCLAEVQDSLSAPYVAQAGFFKPVLLPAECTMAVGNALDGTGVWLSSRDDLNAVVVVHDGA